VAAGDAHLRLGWSDGGTINAANTSLLLRGRSGGDGQYSGGGLRKAAEDRRTPGRFARTEDCQRWEVGRMVNGCRMSWGNSLFGEGYRLGFGGVFYMAAPGDGLW